jgi:hypothetical protein
MQEDGGACLRGKGSGLIASMMKKRRERLECILGVA